MCGFKRYYLADGTQKRTSMSFIAKHLLSINKTLSTSSENTGGWATAELNKSLNKRLYNAIPIAYKQLVKQARISSSVGNKSTDVSTSNCYIHIPAAYEVDPTRQLNHISTKVLQSRISQQMNQGLVLMKMEMFILIGFVLLTLNIQLIIIVLRIMVHFQDTIIPIMRMVSVSCFQYKNIEVGVYLPLLLIKEATMLYKVIKTIESLMSFLNLYFADMMKALIL